MGWESFHIDIPLMLDAHAGDKEREHTQLAAKLIQEIKEIVERGEYAEIVPYFDPPDLYED